MDVILSNTIKWIRIPLAILVIFVHCSPLAYGDYNPDAILFSRQGVFTAMADFIGFIANCAVPSFFLISGYLFFANVKAFDWHVYVHKLKGRVNTLVVPFLFWNICVLFLGLLIIAINAYRQKMCVVDSLLSELSTIDVYDVLISYKDTGVPCYLIMWYVRDLIVMSVLSPIFYLLSKYTKYLFLFLAIALYSFTDFHLFWLQGRAIFYFGVGCWLSVNRIDVLGFIDNIWARYGTPAFIVLGAVYLVVVGVGLNEWVDKMLAIGIVFSFFVGAVWCVKSNHLSLFYQYSSTTMFVYCTHILQPANKCTLAALAALIINKSLGWIPVAGSFVSYLCTPFLTITLCVALYKLLFLIFPRFTSAISGNKQYIQCSQ